MIEARGVHGPRPSRSRAKMSRTGYTSETRQWPDRRPVRRLHLSTGNGMPSCHHAEVNERGNRSAVRASGATRRLAGSGCGHDMLHRMGSVVTTVPGGSRWITIASTHSPAAPPYGGWRPPSSVEWWPLSRSPGAPHRSGRGSTPPARLTLRATTLPHAAGLNAAKARMPAAKA